MLIRIGCSVLEMSIHRKFLECDLALQLKNLKQVYTFTMNKILPVLGNPLSL